jgi:hypothetical protein
MAKLVRVGWSLVGLVVLVGCSGSGGGPESSTQGRGGSVSFNLLTSSNVQIDAIDYDVSTQVGVDVENGSIPVPAAQAQHVPVLGIQSLSAGDFALTLSATGKLPDGSTVPCTSPKMGFHVNSGVNTAIGDVTITCSITTQSDASGSASVDVSVTTVTNTVGSVIETFGYGPRSVTGTTVGGVCTFPPIAVKIANTNSAIQYAWSATPDGTFALNSSHTSGTYACATPGDKTLTLTGTLNGQTSTKSVTVTCVSCAICGNGILEPGEQCDDGLPHCVNCILTPTCGDDIVDPPEQCEPPNTPTCSPFCTIRGECGDGIVEGAEQCDNGAANSNTTPDACRTNCQKASCGDQVVDPGNGEQCDPPNGTTCDSTCRSIEPPPLHVQCRNCIEGSIDGPLQAAYCDADASCLAVEDCVIDNQCFTPVPGACYCGTTDVNACKADAFTPIGPCHNQIRAGEPTATTNADALNQLFDSGTSTGIAMLILNDVDQNIPECNGTCFNGISVPNFIEPFTFGPRAVTGMLAGGVCTFPPITLQVQSHNPAIAYSWSASPDGTFSLNGTHTSGAYTCTSPGTKQLTLSGMLGGLTQSSSFSVTCNRCGTCGDGIVEDPEQCEPPNTAVCDAKCNLVPECGDGIVEAGEQCDQGALNSDTTPNACRTNCTAPKCGDNVIDTGETCDPPNVNTCNAFCNTGGACSNCIENTPVDGSVQTGYCDPSASCVAVENCVAASKCYNPIPSFCYCGITDATACAKTAFSPTGPCAAEIRAGIPTAVTNADVLGQLFDVSTPTGVAMALLNDVPSLGQECLSVCF